MLRCRFAMLVMDKDSEKNVHFTLENPGELEKALASGELG